MDKKYLILTADDLGYCKERNKGIIECFQSGVLTHSSLLVNMEGSKEGAKMAVENNLPVGLHINLTEGKPVSPPELIRSLLKNNEFRGKFLFKEALKNEEIDTNEILIEIYAQINKFQELVGIKPSHVDGHNHIHVIPIISELLAFTQSKFGIKSIRFPFESNLELNYPWLEKQQLKFLEEMLSNLELAKLHFAGFFMPQNFLGLGLTGSNLTLERIESCFKNLSSKSITEAMFHPGYKQREGNGDLFSRSEDRELEMKILKDPRFKELLKQYNIELISWEKAYNVRF